MGCSPIKAVRGLGSERRETVRSLSGAGRRIFESIILVREDRDGLAAGGSVAPPGAWQIAKPGQDKR